MRVYHGATAEIRFPLVHVGRRDLDFGKGFYVTPIMEQASSWACRPANKHKEHWLNVYDIDYNAVISEFRSKTFHSYNEEWLDFILSCRQGEDKWKAFDFIEGGIANDRIFSTIELYTSHLISKQEALSRLIYENPNQQMCIINQKIITQHLTFIESQKL
ncbi:MAG: DUF3990 domain-containing protein [Prevotella sp.]|jgi:hypothetical protein|nr:DUF3990 domain-containing protein [uncultured Prevotella sp.]MBF1626955.1 DUF3990 domain-containing protein [Prevotella sp.]MBF1638613.1 DUF3990 domain-containing protein [Prevotella sp.]